MAHLFVAVTAHGYGHLAQIAPVLHELRRRRPDLRITLQADLNPEFLAYRLPSDIDVIRQAADVALPMDSPLSVRWDLGLALYEAFEADYQAHLSRELALLEAQRPDLLLADIPWMPLDAARRLGLPAVALCSLNWLDILLESPIGARVSTALTERMRAAYGQADLFIRPAPSMPMAWLEKARDVGPIAEQRPRDSGALRARLGIEDDRMLVLMQFGGTGALRLDPAPLSAARLQILTADRAIPPSPVVSQIGGPGLGMLEVLASCDAMITKPGYGSFAEAACNGIPVLYAPREDWPETPALVDWLQRQVPSAPLAPDALERGDIVGPLSDLLACRRPVPIEPSGTEETVELLLPWLRSA